MVRMTQEDAVNRLAPHHDAIRQTVLAGYGRLNQLIDADGGNLAAPLVNQTRSSALNNYITDQAVTSLTAFNHLVSNRVHLFQLEDIAIRFKKLGPDGLPCNIRTKHATALCNGGQQLSIFENAEPLYLTIGYEVDPGWAGIRTVAILCMAGPRNTNWSYIIPKSNTAVPIQGYMPDVVPPLPKPIVVPKAKVSIRNKKQA